MINSNQRVLKTGSIGSIALEALSDNQDAHVLGKTSKGVFIKTSGRWLVFLSFEQFRGPLTITLDDFDPALQLVSSGDPVRISSRSIFIPDLDLAISLEGSQVWQPPLPSAPLLNISERYEKLALVAKEIWSQKKAGGFGNLIPTLVGLPNSQPLLPTKIVFDGVQLELIKKYVSIEEVSPLVELLSSALGSGLGLTPSADDFIVGLLLVLNRWHIPPWTKDGLGNLNHRVVEAAYHKTTTLSANLIECAMQGLANERLINALDLLVTGVAREPEVVAHLLEWGNSSGVDAFVGMAVVLKT